MRAATADSAITTLASVTALSHSQSMHTLLRCDGDRGTEGTCSACVDPFLDDVAEMPDESLHRPCCGIAERADGMAFDLVADIKQHIDLGELGFTARHPLKHAPHPSSPLATRRTLSAGLVLVEIGE